MPRLPLSGPTSSNPSGDSARVSTPISTASTSASSKKSRWVRSSARPTRFWTRRSGGSGRTRIQSFSWIHLYDPHTPYEPPPPFAEKYPQSPYVGEIAFVDSELSRLGRFLDENNLSENSLLVIAGDHGESLGEHGESSHGFFIYQEAIHVPLIFVTPFSRFKGLSAPAVVSLIDVMPTVLEMTGLPVPAEVQGESLVPFFFRPEDDPERYAYSETYYPRFHYGWSELRSFQDKRHKLIIAPQKELYDLAADADEMRDLAAVETGVVGRLNGAAE